MSSLKWDLPCYRKTNVSKLASSTALPVRRWQLSFLPCKGNWYWVWITLSTQKDNCPLRIIIKWKSLSRVRLWDPMDCTIHGILQARILEWVAFPFSRGFSQPRDQTQVSRIASGFFTSWATGKPKNTGVGSLSLLQQIFLTQELNWGLLHCRQILYQLSYQ